MNAAAAAALAEAVGHFVAVRHGSMATLGKLVSVTDRYLVVETPLREHVIPTPAVDCWSVLKSDPNKRR